MLNVEAISPKLNYGSIIRGITLDDVRRDEIRKQLYNLWIERGLVLFRDTQIDNELHLELSRVFGPLERHFQEDKIVDDKPELVWFSSDVKTEGILEIDGVPLVGCIPWHADFHWHPQPNHGGILRVIREPAHGGETGFIDRIHAYETLPEHLKKRIEGLEVVYRLRIDEKSFQYFTRQKVRLVQMGSTFELINAHPEKFPPVAYPLVRVQPQTGRKMIFLAPMQAQYIVGMDPKESFELLTKLVHHVTDPAYAYFHEWEKTDMVLWDNLRMIHTAAGVSVGEQRLVWRTTIASDEVIGRKLEDGGWDWHHGTQPAAAVK